jgi:hypothetical protein
MGGTCRLHPQDRRIRQVRNQREGGKERAIVLRISNPKFRYSPSFRLIIFCQENGLPKSKIMHYALIMKIIRDSSLVFLRTSPGSSTGPHNAGKFIACLPTTATGRTLHILQYTQKYSYITFITYYIQHLWSSGQSSWLQIRRPGFDSRHL